MEYINEIRSYEWNAFNQLNENFQQDGILVSWFNNHISQAQILVNREYLERENLQDFRRSRTWLQSVKEKITHWRCDKKEDFERFAEDDSDSEYEYESGVFETEEKRRVGYTGPSSFTYLTAGNRFDDYRYSERINNDGIGVLVLPQKIDVFRGFLQCEKTTAYTEFTDIHKNELFHLPEEHRGTPAAIFSVNQNLDQMKETIQDFQQKFWNYSQENYSHWTMEDIQNRFNIPYNEALIRYKAEYVSAIVVNDEGNEAGSIKNALKFYKELKSINPNTNPVFCYYPRCEGHLKLLPIENIVEKIGEERVAEIMNKPQQIDVMRRNQGNNMMMPGL